MVCSIIRPKSDVIVISFIFQLIGNICFTNPSAWGEGGKIFKVEFTGLKSEFSFSYTSGYMKVKEPSPPSYLSIDRGRIVGCISLPRGLALCEMYVATFRIWTRVDMSISYNTKYYTTNASNSLEITRGELICR